MPDQLQPTIKQLRDLKQEEKERRRQAAQRQNRVKNIVTWGIVGLVLAGVVALIVVSSKGSTSSGTLAPITDQDHLRGSLTAKAMIIEYSDFQCPACGLYYPILKELETKYGEKIGVVYRHFPLTTVHQYSQQAAQASEAAQFQGKFWEMHDKLFEEQKNWSVESDVKKVFTEYAKGLGLDPAKFSDDMNSSAVKDRITKDVDNGNAIKISGTPTFYLNGSKISNPGTTDAFAKLIDDALAQP